MVKKHQNAEKSNNFNNNNNNNNNNIIIITWRRRHLQWRIITDQFASLKEFEGQTPTSTTTAQMSWNPAGSDGADLYVYRVGR